jgi:hypothetical protein
VRKNRAEPNRRLKDDASASLANRLKGVKTMFTQAAAL